MTDQTARCAACDAPLFTLIRTHHHTDNGRDVTAADVVDVGWGAYRVLAKRAMEYASLKTGDIVETDDGSVYQIGRLGARAGVIELIGVDDSWWTDEHLTYVADSWEGYDR